MQCLFYKELSAAHYDRVVCTSGFTSVIILYEQHNRPFGGKKISLIIRILFIPRDEYRKAQTFRTRFRKSFRDRYHFLRRRVKTHHSWTKFKKLIRPPKKTRRSRKRITVWVNDENREATWTSRLITVVWSLVKIKYVYTQRRGGKISFTRRISGRPRSLPPTFISISTPPPCVFSWTTISSVIYGETFGFVFADT